MKDLFFWNKWTVPPRIGYTFALLCLVAAISAALFMQHNGVAAFYKVINYTELDSVEIVVDTFMNSYLQFTFKMPNFLVLSRHQLAGTSYTDFFQLLYLAVTWLSLSLLLSVVSMLRSRIWFYVGLAPFVFLFALLDWVQIQPFGWNEQVVLVALTIIYGVVAYIFHAFAEHIAIGWRWLVFSVISVAIFYGLQQGTNVNLISHLAQYGLVLPLIITVLFVLIVAVDNMAILLLIATESSLVKGKAAFINFLVLSFIYLGNVLLVYLKMRYVIDWELYYITPLGLLTVSAVLGIWGFRQRNKGFANVLPFFLGGALLYIGLGVIAFSTIAYMYAIGNDALITAFETIILLVHFGVGAVFLIYVFVNFGALLWQGLQVHKVLYEPKLLPFEGVHFGGIFVIAAMLFYDSLFPLKQGMSGYYSALAEHHLKEKDDFSAENLLQKATDFTTSNHLALYRLYEIAQRNEQEEKGISFIQIASSRVAFPFTYLQLAEMYMQQQHFFDAIFTLQKGMQEFPQSSELANNMAMLYYKTEVLDSTLFYLKKAEKLAQTEAEKQAVYANLIAFAAKKSILTDNDDTLPQSYSSCMPCLANTLALRNLKGKKQGYEALIKPDLFAADYSLSEQSFAYLYNSQTTLLLHQDTAYSQLLGKFLANAANNPVAEDLSVVAAAKSYYVKQNKLYAVQLLQAIEEKSGFMKKYYAEKLGHWASQHEAHAIAEMYYQKSFAAGLPEAALPYLISIAQRSPQKALDSLNYYAEQIQDKTVVQQLRQVLQANNLSDLLALEEPNRMIAFALHKNKLTAAQGSQVRRSFVQQPYKDWAMLENIKQYIAENNFTQAEQLYNSTVLLPENAALAQPIYWQLLAQKEKWQAIIDDIAESKTKHYEANTWKAEAFTKLGQYEPAEKAYRNIIQDNPFDTQQIVAAVQFIDEVRKDSVAAYDLVLEGIDAHRKEPTLWKAYIRLCLKRRLLDFAKSGMEELQKLTTEADYRQFEQFYNNTLAKLEKETE